MAHSGPFTCQCGRIHFDQYDGPSNDLLPYIDTEGVAALNESERGAVSGAYPRFLPKSRPASFLRAPLTSSNVRPQCRRVFKPYEERQDRTKFMDSEEDDPQVIIHIPFTCPVKIRAIVVMGGPEGAAPLRLRAFINREALDFSDAEDAPATQVRGRASPCGAVRAVLLPPKRSSAPTRDAGVGACGGPSGRDRSAHAVQPFPERLEAHALCRLKPWRGFDPHILHWAERRRDRPQAQGRVLCVRDAGLPGYGRAKGPGRGLTAHVTCCTIEGGVTARRTRVLSCIRRTMPHGCRMPCPPCPGCPISVCGPLVRRRVWLITGFLRLPQRTS